MKDETAYIHFL